MNLVQIAMHHLKVIYLIVPTVIIGTSDNVLASSNSLNSSSTPTNYEYYTASGINSGLNADEPNFHLNGKEIFVYSGSIHYFRVPRTYWRDRLRKLRAAGLNTVETCIPWNLHEPRSGEYDFGDGGNDMSDFLHLQEFLQIAKEEDLFAIVRSGPYMRAEFEFGGFPSWLLRNDGIEFRTSNSIYMNYVTRWFKVLMPILAELQFTKGGPIIMFQVENEYADSGKHDSSYLQLLRDAMIDNGIQELLVTADIPVRGSIGTLVDLFLMTGNLDRTIETQLDMLKMIQPDNSTMTMEFWGDWFDYWGGENPSRNRKDKYEFKYPYEQILEYPSSVNIYMFHGGTNFGFLNGARNLKFAEDNTDYHSIISSNQDNSPLKENGDYTDKYWITKELLEKYNPIKTQLPDVPELTKKTAYSSVTMNQEMILYDILENITPVYSSNVIPMEKLDINNGNGQSFGYVVYRKTDLTIPANAVLEIEGRVCDTFMILVNGVLVTPWLEKSADLKKIGTSMVKNSNITLTDKDLTGARLEIVVENWGRVSVGVYKQFKGLWQGGVKLNDEYLYDWAIYPLEFKSTWTNGLSQWQNTKSDSIGPVLYKGTLTINDTPEDTFVFMHSWTKGIVIVNGFVLGRYAKMGPIQTLYLPAPLLVQGDNTIIVFEHFKSTTSVSFRQNHVYMGS